MLALTKLSISKREIISIKKPEKEILANFIDFTPYLSDPA
ncbi:hypothetical protein O53_4367 [Microcystis aeruginosa TAIHU98]|uniref:Uncharacterized protein n=1 Tax=Microcystis aeruginosa TAIHU98 TaxID=1134457 RepID=L7E2Y9_MICAE|nr:hypothetical protein O53_4367 [Microcystis aeruginosa TAIHU98]